MDLTISPQAITTDVETTDNSRDNAELSSEYTDSSYKSLLKHFDLEESESTNKHMKTIWDYASKLAGSKDKDDVIWQVIKLNHRVGQGDGRTRDHVKLVSYITAWKRMEDAENMVKEMETNGR